MKHSKAGYGRFVLAVGAVQHALSETSPAFAKHAANPYAGLTIWDIQEEAPVAIFPPRYAQAICLETTDAPENQPFTMMERWFNELEDESLKSEGIPATNWPLCAARLLHMERHLG